MLLCVIVMCDLALFEGCLEYGASNDENIYSIGLIKNHIPLVDITFKIL